jgi:hypothetical protein
MEHSPLQHQLASSDEAASCLPPCGVCVLAPVYHPGVSIVTEHQGSKHMPDQVSKQCVPGYAAVGPVLLLYCHQTPYQRRPSIDQGPVEFGTELGSF